MNTISKKSETKIRKIGRIKDKATNTVLDVIEFPVSESKTERLELAPSVVSDPVAFAKKLRDAGADLPKDQSELKVLLLEVANSDAPKEWVYEAQTGWLKALQAFVTMNGIIGPSSTNVIGINPAHSIRDPRGRLTKSGTWESWRSSVAELARYLRSKGPFRWIPPTVSTFRKSPD